MRTKLAWSRVWGRWLAIVSLSVACSGAIVTGKETEKKSHTTTAPQELRAVWASTLSPCMNSPEEIQALVSAVRRAHINTVIAQVRHRGNTWYNSEIEPPAPEWSERKGFDPLATLLREAHEPTTGAQRLDVYAWFNIFSFGDPDSTRTKGLGTALRHKIRDWLSYDTSGTRTTFLDPGLPEVQEHLLSLIEECVRKYDVDGVNLDFIRYPETEAGYHPRAIERFNRLYGRSGTPSPNDPQWNEFRRAQVTGFVRRVAATVWSVRPNAVVSVCAVGFGAPAADGDFTKSAPYRQVHQDWAGWAREGCVDIVTRMGYKREHVAAHAKQFRDWAALSRRLQDECAGRLVTLGIGGFFNSTTGTLAQYRVAKELGLGTSLFSYWRPTVESDTTKAYGAESPFWDLLGQEIYPEAVDPPRPTWRNAVATLAVSVRDPKGRALDGAQVSVSGKASKQERADGNGWAVFVNLTPGKYRIEVKSGSQRLVREVEAKAGKVDFVKLTLK